MCNKVLRIPVLSASVFGSSKGLLRAVHLHQRVLDGHAADQTGGAELGDGDRFGFGRGNGYAHVQHAFDLRTGWKISVSRSRQRSGRCGEGRLPYKSIKTPTLASRVTLTEYDCVYA